MKKNVIETKMDNCFYKSGYEIGLKYGPIKTFGKILKLGDETLYDMSKKELEEEIVRVYIELEEKIPECFINTNNSKKDFELLLLGYVDGKINHSRNKADKKYHEKIGLISKSYKIHKDVADSFAEACEKAEVSLGSTIERIMERFIDEVNERK